MILVSFAVNYVTVPLGTEPLLHRIHSFSGTTSDGCTQRHDDITLILERFRFVLPLLLQLYGIKMNVNMWDLMTFVW